MLSVQMILKILNGLSKIKSALKIRLVKRNFLFCFRSVSFSDGPNHPKTAVQDFEIFLRLPKILYMFMMSNKL